MPKLQLFLREHNTRPVRFRVRKRQALQDALQAIGALCKTLKKLSTHPDNKAETRA